MKVNGVKNILRSIVADIDLAVSSAVLAEYYQALGTQDRVDNRAIENLCVQAEDSPSSGSRYRAQ